MEIYNRNPLVYNDYEWKENKSNPLTNKQDKEWYKYWANSYISSFSHENWKEEEKMYRAYRGIRNEEDMQEIREVYGGALPVPDVPHIPLMETYIGHIISTSSQRPLVYNISTTDVDAIQEADAIRIKEVAKDVTQQLSQSITQEISNPQDKEKINQELQDRIKKVTSKLSDFKIVQERIASKFLNMAMERKALRQKWNIAMSDKLITGKEYYKCKLHKMGDLPDYEIVNPKEISFPIEDVENLNECSFVVHRRYLTFQEIYVLYGHLFTSEDVAKIDKYKLQYSSSTNNTYTSITEKGTGYYGSASANLFEVHEVEWKANKKIAVKDFEGKLESLSGKDGLVKDEKKISYRYYQELHTCIRIQGDIFVKYGIVENARRDISNVSKVYLSYNGRLYNNRNTPPVSLVRELKDLQDRYDILWYKLLELIMLSGTKGVNMIKELLPPDMSVDEWFYHRKLGLSQFSISGEGAEKLIGQIGQAITPFDDSLSPNSVQSLILAIEQIKKTMGEICGVTPQMLGQTKEYETKANTEISITQGNITLEILHKDHSEFIRQSLNDILHWLKISMQEGTLKDYILTQEEQTLNLIGWNFIDYGIEVVDSYTEEKNLREVKSVMTELVKSQAIGADTLIKGMVSKSTNEVSKIIDEAVKEMRETQQKNMQAEQQAENQKLQAEMQIKQGELELKKQELQAKIKQDEDKLVLEKEQNTLKEEEIEIKSRLATVEEKYVDIAQQELNNNLSNTNNKVASRQTPNNKQ